jgi:hypothetical protein
MAVDGKEVTHMVLIKEGKAEVEDMAATVLVVVGAMMVAVEAVVEAVAEAVEEAVGAAVTHGKTVQVWSKMVSW